MKAFFLSYYQELPDPIKLLLLVVLCAVLGFFFSRIAFSIILRRFSPSSRFIRDSVRKHLSGEGKLFFPLLMVYVGLPFLGISSKMESVASQVLLVLLFLDFGWLLLKGLNVLEDGFFDAYKVRKDKYLKERKIRTQIQFLKKALSVLIVLLVTASILLSFEAVQKIGFTLLTSTAIIGIVVGLAAQKTIGNLIHGFQIAFTQPVKIDDTVLVKGEWGTVEEITLTYVVVKVWDKRRLLLPISFFIEEPFENWTRNSEDIMGEVSLYLDPRMPVSPLRERLKELAKEHRFWDGRVCRLQVVGMSERSMEVKAVVSAEDADKVWDLKCDIREGLIAFLRDQYAHVLPRFPAFLADSAS